VSQHVAPSRVCITSGVACGIAKPGFAFTLAAVGIRGREEQEGGEAEELGEGKEFGDGKHGRNGTCVPEPSRAAGPGLPSRRPGRKPPGYAPFVLGGRRRAASSAPAPPPER